MRKIIFTIILFVFSLLPCLAEYNPIPKDRQQEYKLEMEAIIDRHIPIIKKESNRYLNDAKKYRNKILKKKLRSNSDEYNNLANISEMGESLVLIPVIYDLIKATNKYNNIDESIADTDFWITPANILFPILEENNVDISKLTKSIHYAEKKWNSINKYYNEVRAIY